MNLTTPMIPQLLDAAPGRHILYEGGIFRMKEASGRDVMLTALSEQNLYCVLAAHGWVGRYCFC